MDEPSEAIRDIRERMEATLKSGKRLWLVTGPVVMQVGGPAPRLLTAPKGPSGWNWEFYGATWSKQAGAFVGSHAQGLHKVGLTTEGPVNPFEDLKLIVVEGWREN